MYAIENTTESLQNGTLTTDTYGLQHYTLKQYHKGIPVFDAQLKFHFDRENNLKAINGTIIPDRAIYSMRVQFQILNYKQFQHIPKLKREISHFD